jgi:hypothetical protein
MRVEKEEGVLVLTGDANVGLVPGGRVTERGFAAAIEGVAIVSRALGVVEDRLIAEGHTEDLTQDLSRFAGGEGKGDVEGQDQPQHIGRAMNAGQVDGGPIGSGRGQLSELKVVFAILIAELELGEAQLLQQLLVPLQSLLLLEVVRAAVARALIEGGVGALLPAIEGAVAVGTPVTGGVGEAMARSELRQATTDFATQLAGLATIVEVEEPRGCAAVGTTSDGRHRAGTATPPHRRQWPTVVSLVLSTQLLPVQGGGWRGQRRGLGQGGQGIDVEIAIVGMLLAKVVAGLRLGLTPGENLLQLINELLQVLRGKFPAEPKHQSWYLAHGGDSLGNLAGSWKVDWERESAPPFLFGVKSPRISTLKAEWGKPTCLYTDPGSLRSPGGESRNASIPQKFNRLSA